jgi:hypothetical protein
MTSDGPIERSEGFAQPHEVKMTKRTQIQVLSTGAAILKVPTTPMKITGIHLHIHLEGTRRRQ